MVTLDDKGINDTMSSLLSPYHLRIKHVRIYRSLWSKKSYSETILCAEKKKHSLFRRKNNKEERQESKKIQQYENRNVISGRWQEPIASEEGETFFFHYKECRPSQLLTRRQQGDTGLL